MRRLTEIMDFTIDDLCKSLSISKNNIKLNDIVNKFIEAIQKRKIENYAQWKEIKTEAKTNDLLRYMLYRNQEIAPQMIEDLLLTEKNPDIAIAVLARDDLSPQIYQKVIKTVSEEMIIEKFKEINLNYDADRSFYLAFPVQTYGHIPTYESYYFSQTTMKYMIEEMIKNNKPMYEGFPLKYIYSEEKLEDIFNKLSNEEQITTNIAENPHLPMELRERAYALGFNHNESSTNTPPFVCEELYKSCIDIYTEEDYSTSTKEMLNLVSENGKQLIKILKTGNLPESCQLDLYKRLKTIFHDSQNVFNKLVLTATSKQLLNEIATFEQKSIIEFYSNVNVTGEMLKKRATFLIGQLDYIKKLKILTVRVKKYKQELAYIMNRCQLSTDEYDHIKQQNDKVLNLVMFSSIYTPTKHLMENLEGCPYEELLKLLSKKFMKMDENETVRQCFLNVFKSHLSSQDILNDEDFDNIDLKPTLLEDISIFNDVIRITSQKQVNVLNIIFSQTEKDIEKMGYKHHEEMKNILEQYKSIVNRQIELYKTYSNINQTLGINLFKADGEIDANEFEMLPLDEKTKKLFEKELRNSAFFDEFEINLAVLKVTKINERDPIGAIKVINKTKKLDELLNNERVQEDIIPEK